MFQLFCSEVPDMKAPGYLTAERALRRCINVRLDSGVGFSAFTRRITSISIIPFGFWSQERVDNCRIKFNFANLAAFVLQTNYNNQDFLSSRCHSILLILS